MAVGMALEWAQDIAESESACNSGSSGKQFKKRADYMLYRSIFWNICEHYLACVQILTSSLSSERLTRFLSSETLRNK